MPAANDRTPLLDRKVSLKIGRSHWTQSSAVIVANMLGAGVLQVPDAFRQCGWVVGSIMLVVMTLASIYGGVLLGKLRGDKTFIQTYGDLVQHVVSVAFDSPKAGTYSRYVINTLGYIYLVGAMCVYLITASDSFTLVFPEMNLTVTEWLLASAICVFPLIQIRNLHDASFVSVIGVLTIVVVNVMLFVRIIRDVATKGDINVDYGGQTFESKINGITSLTFAYGGHVIMIDIIKEMKKPFDFHKSVYSSQLFMFANYALMGVGGFYVYGNKVQSPITKNFPNDLEGKIMNANIFVHVLIAFCINSQVVVHALCLTLFPTIFAVPDDEDVLKTTRKLYFKQMSYWALISFGLLSLAFGASALIPFMSDMMSLFSCLGVFTISMAFPPLIYACYLYGSKVNPKHLLDQESYLQTNNNNSHLTVPTSNPPTMTKTYVQYSGSVSSKTNQLHDRQQEEEEEEEEIMISPLASPLGSPRMSPSSRSSDRAALINRRHLSSRMKQILSEKERNKQRNISIAIIIFNCCLAFLMLSLCGVGLWAVTKQIINRY